MQLYSMCLGVKGNVGQGECGSDSAETYDALFAAVAFHFRELTFINQSIRLLRNQFKN